MKRRTKTMIQAVVLFSAVCGLAFAGTGLTIDWHTIDGGGVMQSTGGDFTLSGTIGQHDPNDTATAMTGGDFALVGGFWAVAVPICGCLSDVNNDGNRDALDVQGFVDCLTAVGANCACADVDGNSGLDVDDVAAFVADLLGGAACP